MSHGEPECHYSEIGCAELLTVKFGEMKMMTIIDNASPLKFKNFTSQSSRKFIAKYAGKYQQRYLPAM